MDNLGGGGGRGKIRNDDLLNFPNDWLHRLLEINRQIETLRREQEHILQSLLPDTEPELFFDDDKRRIRWNGNSVKLGKKSYEFIKILWFGENHQAEIIELEENIWTQSTAAETFVPQSTIIMLVRHVQKNLIEVNFPYRIEAVKNFSSKELEGFQLIICNDKNKTLSAQGIDSL